MLEAINLFKPGRDNKWIESIIVCLQRPICGYESTLEHYSMSISEYSHSLLRFEVFNVFAEKVFPLATKGGRQMYFLVNGLLLLIPPLTNCPATSPGFIRESVAKG